MKKGIIIAIGILLLCLGAGIWLISMGVFPVGSKGDQKLVSVFNDQQSRQIKAALKLGFPGAPLKDREAVDSVKEHLRKVRTNRMLQVSHLSHSVPYLVPEAHTELYSIAADFQERVRQKHLPNCRIVVTSVLRTEWDVERLRQSNQNSVSQSAHLYGTTFDIAWNSYLSAGRNADGEEYLRILSDVLKEHRDSKRIYVKYESRQKCFHITVRPAE